MRFLVSEKLGPHKYKTPEGYLICTDAILSRTGKQEYRRREIFGDSCENPDDVIMVDRTDDEVFSDKAIASFENKAICIEHPDVDVNAENHNELAVGFVRDVHKGEYQGKPVMMGTLVITDKQAVDAVESKEYEELSCGYDCDINDDSSPCQRNIRGNHVALCKQGRAGIAHIVDSDDDSGSKVWQIHQGYAIVPERYWKQYGKNAYVDAVESSIDAARYHRGSLERSDKMTFVIVDCNDGKYKIEDSEMKDIAATKKAGTDKIIYVMQSDIDKNLFFYIGKTFSMKEGAWGYTKFEMESTTPEQLKAELAKNGWHQVANGPARIIDMQDAMLSGRYVYFKFDDVKGKSLKQEIEKVYNSKFKADVKVKRLDKHWVPGKREVEIQVYADGMHEGFAGFWAVVAASEEESKLLKDDDWIDVEEENYKKANNIEVDDAKYKRGDKLRHKEGDVEEVASIITESSAGYSKSGSTATKYVMKSGRKYLASDIEGKNWTLIRDAKDECDDVPEKTYHIYVKNQFGTYKVADWTAVSKEAAVKEFLELNPKYRKIGIIEARDSVKKDSLYTVEFEHEGVTHVHKVHAATLEDAIEKAKLYDLEPGVLTLQEANNILSIIKCNYQSVAQNTWVDGLAYVDRWRDGYWVTSSKIDLTRFARFIGREYRVSKHVIVKK